MEHPRAKTSENKRGPRGDGGFEIPRSSGETGSATGMRFRGMCTCMPLVLPGRDGWSSDAVWVYLQRCSSLCAGSSKWSSGNLTPGGDGGDLCVKF
jgi:hypothetical protein